MHPYFYRPSMGASSTADVETAPLKIGAGSWLGGSGAVRLSRREPY
jgi:hypothetical protein